MISVDLFNPEQHYKAAAQWWEAQGWPVMPLSHLPKTGLMVSYDGKPAAVAWLYKTDSALCWVEWIVANPEIRHEARASALSALVSGMKVLAQTLGFESIFMSIKNQSLAKRIESHGFAASDREMTNYVCALPRRD